MALALALYRAAWPYVALYIASRQCVTWKRIVLQSVFKQWRDLKPYTRLLFQEWVHYFRLFHDLPELVDSDDEEVDSSVDEEVDSSDSSEDDASFDFWSYALTIRTIRPRQLDVIPGRLLAVD